MRRLAAIAQVVFGFALLVALIAAVSWVVYTTVTEAPAVVAAVVTGFAALIGIAAQRYYEQQREDERERRERMAPIYEELVRTFYRGASRGEVADSELRAFLDELAQQLLIWGSGVRYLRVQSLALRRSAVGRG